MFVWAPLDQSLLNSIFFNLIFIKFDLYLIRSKYHSLRLLTKKPFRLEYSNKRRRTVNKAVLVVESKLYYLLAFTSLWHFKSYFHNLVSNHSINPKWTFLLFIIIGRQNLIMSTLVFFICLACILPHQICASHHRFTYGIQFPQYHHCHRKIKLLLILSCLWFQQNVLEKHIYNHENLQKMKFKESTAKILRRK